ncbi:MAG: hypothetical protein KF849_14195 [Rhizobiaceae bacterium]|nr:hypothetical protein [Rhizobiaceae bacterium]
MNIQLKKRYGDWIAEQISAGRYATEIEAIEDAIAAKIEREEVELLRAKVERSEREHAEGRYVIADEAFFERKKQMIRDRFMKGSQ